MLTFIIPVYNRANLLPFTLDSIQAQKSEDWECIIVDDHSSDGSVEIAQKYAQRDERFRIFVRPDNTRKGAGSCRNEGLKHVRGEYIFFMDSDDLIAPEFCESFVNYFLEYPSLDYLNIRFARFKTNVVNCYRISSAKPRGLTIAEAIAARKISFATHSFIWRSRFLLSQNEFWIADIHIYEDFEFALRLVLSSSNGLHVPNPVCYFYRKHSGELRNSVNNKRLCHERLLNLSVVLGKMIDTCIALNAKSKIQNSLARLLIKKMLQAVRCRFSDIFDILAQLIEKLECSTLVKCQIKILHILRRLCLPKK